MWYSNHEFDRRVFHYTDMTIKLALFVRSIYDLERCAGFRWSFTSFVSKRAKIFIFLYGGFAKNKDWFAKVRIT